VLTLAGLLLAACSSGAETSTQISEPNADVVVGTSTSIVTESPVENAPIATPEPLVSPSTSQPEPTEAIAPTSSGWPPQTNAAEIQPPEMRGELNLLSNLLGFQVVDINGAPLGIAADYVINTCETFIIYISLQPDPSVNNQSGMRMMLPFEMVTLNSGVLDAVAKTIGSYLPPEPFQFAPLVPEAMNLTPTGWETGTRDYWSPFIRLSDLTTECMVPDPVSGELVPVYKTAYASELLEAKLKDGLEKELGTVVEAILEPESGKLRFYVVKLSENQSMTLVPLSKTNIPKEVLDSGSPISLVLLTENEKLLNAPRFDSLEDATSGGAFQAAFEYW
jgi:sporulation protein YlmC with PRC-barrel domain